MPSLPYAAEALAPYMSKETIDFHYGKHLQTYVDNLNKLIPGTPYEKMSLEQIIRKAEGPVFNNAAQTWNHTFFFQTLTPQPAAVPEKLTELRFRVGRSLQGGIQQGRTGSLRIRMGMAGIRQAAQAVHCQYAERRKSAYPRSETDIGHRCMGTCLLY